jgi:hypothetical protein
MISQLYHKHIKQEGKVKTGKIIMIKAKVLRALKFTHHNNMRVLVYYKKEKVIFFSKIGIIRLFSNKILK